MAWLQEARYLLRGGGSLMSEQVRVVDGRSTGARELTGSPLSGISDPVFGLEACEIAAPFQLAPVASGRPTLRSRGTGLPPKASVARSGPSATRLSPRTSPQDAQPLPQRTAHLGRRAPQHVSGSPAAHQNAFSEAAAPVKRVSVSRRRRRLPVPSCSSARSLTLLFALVVAGCARRRSISVRWVGGAIYRTVVIGDQGVSRAHRTL